MKNVVKSFAAFALITMALASCNTEKTTTIVGVLNDSTLNGKTVYLIDYANQKSPIDSAVINDYKFQLKVPADTIRYCRLYTNRAFINLLTEPGKLKVALGDPSQLIKCGELNQKYQQLTTDLKKVTEEYINLNPNDQLIKGDSLQAIYNNIITEVREANRKNQLGVITLYMQARDMSLNTLDSMISRIPMAANYGPIKEMRENLLRKEATQVGKAFKDFTGKDMTNTKTVSFSEYIGKGQYVLVDFWASWCGPCRREIPNLKVIKNTYKKDFVLLGVNVWDRYDAFKESISKEGMDWAQIYASDDKSATDIYGIDAIPQIILFGPDGTILARDLRGNLIQQELDKYLK